MNSTIADEKQARKQLRLGQSVGMMLISVVETEQKSRETLENEGAIAFQQLNFTRTKSRPPSGTLRGLRRRPDAGGGGAESSNSIANSSIGPVSCTSSNATTSSLSSLSSAHTAVAPLCGGGGVLAPYPTAPHPGSRPGSGHHHHHRHHHHHQPHHAHHHQHLPPAPPSQGIAYFRRPQDVQYQQMTYYQPAVYQTQAGPSVVRPYGASPIASPGVPLCGVGGAATSRPEVPQPPPLPRRTSSAVGQRQGFSPAGLPASSGGAHGTRPPPWGASPPLVPQPQPQPQPQLAAAAPRHPPPDKPQAWLSADVDKLEAEEEDGRLEVSLLREASLSNFEAARAKIWFQTRLESSRIEADLPSPPAEAHPAPQPGGRDPDACRSPSSPSDPRRGSASTSITPRSRVKGGGGGRGRDGDRDASAGMPATAPAAVSPPPPGEGAPPVSGAKRGSGGRRRVSITGVVQPLAPADPAEGGGDGQLALPETRLIPASPVGEPDPPPAVPGFSELAPPPPELDLTQASVAALCPLVQAVTPFLLWPLLSSLPDLAQEGGSGGQGQRDEEKDAWESGSHAE